ncbi:hypothetical protein [Stappia sp.]|uniref:hypothetical protein n=1 Tax=Stappia sp. TaxID=1870903 RepID=UPI003D133131
MAELVGVNLCGDEEQGRRKANAFQGLATLTPVQIRPIRGTFDLTAICRVKAFDRGANPALRAFPSISCHVERHFRQSSES